MTPRPKRSLGQNFLADRDVSARIVEETRVGPGETVMEIGPGKGALTEGLVRCVEEQKGRLILVELDDELAADLVRRFRGCPRVEVIHRDILLVSLAEVTSSPADLKVIGNIPYNLTSPILFHLLARPRPREILLMVQKEVADRILAEPGGREYGALTVGVRAVAGVERVLSVPAGAFRPRPSVDSTVVRLNPFWPNRLEVEEEVRLRNLTRAVFQWRRKQLGKILRDHPDLRLTPDEVDRVLVASGAERSDRPEALDPMGFVAMARAISD